MSIDRRKPFALLQPNDSKPVDAAPTTATATARLTISRPRRQMPAYHYQHHQHPQHSQKRYATMIPGSSRSSATSSAESLYSNAGSVPRRRKLSAAEDVAARVRARWAALEALERAGASSSGTSPSSAQRRRSPSTDELEKEKENAAVPMQVDSYEKPLPPRPPALALHIGAVAAPPEAAPTTAGTTLVVMMDTREDDAPPSAPAALTATTMATTATAAGPPMTGESTVRTTPTSLTFVETDSVSPVLQRRPTRAVTPPQVRRRASITDELEEAREEATLTMLRSPRTDGLLRCPRRGCGELLGGVRALTFHLHIHAVGAGSYACVRCGGAFESARDLARHACARRRARERLRRVVRAWTCLSPTNHPTLEKQPQQQQQRQRHYKRNDDNHYY
ncbi:hypothetical protein EDB92DRAFT_681698 [Lactarius akahatsu]|uniref:C2H2-type domain-containing protein n=1 Tax=Lactarius akahatsu TaxID=416441 RepID=A0AAD4LJS6_9AGAM|nr:hypothetical protein EDB92DRAFT_681698 [Lactarius akahatsu]